MRPFTGRVLVMLGTGSGEPRFGPNWFRPQPFFAMDVKGWRPNQPLAFQDQFSFPRPLQELTAGEYNVQAVMDFDFGAREIGAAPGNGYSSSVRMNLDPKTSGRIALKIDRLVSKRPFRESDSVKLFEMESKLLTDFHGTPTKLRAAVVLPKSFNDVPERKYPIIYEVPGFGGDHSEALFGGQSRTNVAGTEMLFIVLDPNCRTGHHVFADSANNGPYGKALTEEFIPALEKKFRALGNPGARYVTGHSSGGWSSLWLQVAYPDFFGGCWSTAPDPIDFRDFQRINLYRPGTNMFKDEAGNDRPIARRGEQPFIYYKPFSDMEVVMGHGGQLGSFEAVFSPKGVDGKPRQLWDRKTGVIDLETAKAWEPFDINLVLRRNWQTLGPKLKGKLHIYMGGSDTFYLEGATKLVQATLKELGSDAVVEIFPGKDHSTLMTDGAVPRRIKKEMAEQFQKKQAAP